MAKGKNKRQVNEDKYSEDNILKIPAEDIRDMLLDNLQYIDENFGTVKQYYKFTNPKQDEINKRIDQIHRIRMVLMSNPDKAKEIYEVIVGKEKSNPKEASQFYLNIRSDLYLFYYGDYRMEVCGDSNNTGAPFTRTKTETYWAIRLMIKGPAGLEEKIKMNAEKANAAKDDPSQY